jgi:lysophospholipid acyltransferase
MILVIKLSNFAWAYYDGKKPQGNLTEEQKKYAIRKRPGLLEFFGYIFYFGGFFIGPAFEFKDYVDFINQEPPFDNIPSPAWASVSSYGIAFTSFSVYSKAKPEDLVRYAISKEFLQHNIIVRILFYQILGFLFRCRYYGAWKITEASCIATGFGYVGPDPKNPSKHLHNRVENVDILNVEFAPSPKVLIER